MAARNVRARREATLEDIMDRAARAPLAWLPVATMLLHRFGKQSDAEALDGILSKVLVSHCVAVRSPAFPPAYSADR